MLPKSSSAFDARKLAVLLAVCNGATVTALAVIGLAAALAMRLNKDAIAAFVILCVGILEITGGMLVSRCRPEGFRWIRSAQALFFVSFAIYILVRLASFSYANLSSNPIGKVLVDLLTDSNVTEKMAHITLTISGVMVLITFGLFQSGMWIFYGYLQRRTGSL